VLLAGLASGCDDAKDQTLVRLTAGAGGSGGSGGSGAGSGGGNGGAVTEIRDASADATADAADAASSCVVGTLERYCAVTGDCPPSLAAARVELREIYALGASIIVQRPCTAPDGSARVSVSANYASMSKAFIYEAETERLLGVEVIDDLGPCSGVGHGLGTAFGQVAGFYGEESPDCGSGGYDSDFIIPAACSLPDGGAQREAEVLDGGPHAEPYECILTP